MKCNTAAWAKLAIALALVPTAARAGVGVTYVDDSVALGGVRSVSIPHGGVGYTGVAVLDYDVDGDLDLYLGNGPTQPNALLRNDGTGSFTDVAAAAGAEVGTGTGGVLAADLDGDGYPDLVLAGDNARLRVLSNQRDGTFVDRTGATGIEGRRRNISAHAADVDNDGFVDVFVAASREGGQLVPSTLYINRGDGTFEERAAASGIVADRGVCAATFTHIDDDDAIDLVIANCNDPAVVPRRLDVYRNQGDGTFVDAYDSSGVWAVGFYMGLALADFDGNGAVDFFSTNLGNATQPHALYLNQGAGAFDEVAGDWGVAVTAFGWGTVAPDVDNDGWPDLYYVGRSHSGVASSPGLLFANRGGTGFDLPEIPIDLSANLTSGLAHGDLNNDGFPELIAVATEVPSLSSSGAPILLRNQGNDHHWLTVRLTGPGANTAGLGARIRAVTPAGPQLREVRAGSSYKSTNTPWPTFGLGEATTAQVCVRWPDGTGEDFGTLAADQRVDLVYGAGTGSTPCTRASVLEPDPTDTGPPPDTGATDTAVPASPDPDPVSEEEPDGCGCQSGAHPTAAWLLLQRRR